MASSSCLPPGSAPTSINKHRQPLLNSTSHRLFFSFSYCPTNHTLSYTLNLHRPFSVSPTSRCRATPSPPPPSESDPQPPAPYSYSGVGAILTKIQDTAQIFFAVLFWMSLFFWASAWDGRNSDRSDKGSRFRR